MSSFVLPSIRVLRPTLWCAAAVGTIYVGCSAYEVHHDAKISRKVRQMYGLNTAVAPDLAALDVVRSGVAKAPGWNMWTQTLEEGARSRSSRSPPPPTSSLSSLSSIAHTWTSLSESDKLMTGIVSANVGVFALERLLPGTSALFSHLPAAGANFTMFTSAFGHVGLTHLALNMYGVWQFLPPVAYSPSFAGSGSHLAAFYLSSGVLSAFAFHLASVWPRPLDRVIPARGASGAVMAVVGAFGMSYPDAGLGIVLIPGSLPASQFLAGLAVFETYGLFVGFKRLPLAHAAHLAGLAIGSAYVYWDGTKHVWRPLRRWTFGTMRKLGMV